MLRECKALAHRDLSRNRIGAEEAGLEAGVLGECKALAHLTLSHSFNGSGLRERGAMRGGPRCCVRWLLDHSVFEVQRSGLLAWMSVERVPVGAATIGLPEDKPPVHHALRQKRYQVITLRGKTDRGKVDPRYLRINVRGSRVAYSGSWVDRRGSRIEGCDLVVQG